MTEADWQRQVIALAAEHGWKCTHTYKGKVGKGAWRTNTTTVGWPDLVLYRKGELIFVELKTDTGVVSLAQREVLDDLVDAGAECHIWAPRDMPAVARRLSHVR